ncbi:MAG TPA: hypothetical protein VFG62_23885 [Rhodopila sp.]|jgi:D-arabinose 1-dehydrogenase-like Zn-dependent alcohol dehydrogenase|nr:hypothetical protein [Rhodopila sp.]
MIQFGAYEAAGLKAGETVLLIGAAGGGGAAAQIARRLGADQQLPHPDAPLHAVAEKLIIGAEGLPG